MIETEREYQVTKQSIAEFEAALARIDERRDERHPLFHEALRASLEGELAVRREQIAVYEASRHEDNAADTPNPCVSDAPPTPADRRAGSTRRG